MHGFLLIQIHVTAGARSFFSCHRIALACEDMPLYAACENVLVDSRVRCHESTRSRFAPVGPSPALPAKHPSTLSLAALTIDNAHTHARTQPVLILCSTYNPKVDRAVSQLYDKMAEGTLLVVVCQGAVTSLVNLAAKRTKSKWDANNKDTPDSISGRKKSKPPSPIFYETV